MAADVVSPKGPSQLLQRRLSHAQFNTVDMPGILSTFNVAFRPDSNGPMPYVPDQREAVPHQQHGHHQLPPRPLPGYPAPSSIAPQLLNNVAMAPEIHNHGIGPAYAQNYPMMAGFNASFGNLAWNAAPMPTFAPIPAHPLPRQESYASSSTDGFVKSEEPESHALQPAFNRHTYESTPEEHSETEDAKAPVFATEIDNIMRVIQSKSSTSDEAAVPDAPQSIDNNNSPRPRKRYKCDVADCGKSFYQRTHLDIHQRAHTGVKPFVCKEPSCGQRFSQLGNLKTHERRHTGERPYVCDICGKRFAQHGNIRAHKIVHTGEKPFTCLLDDCHKKFSQLGNLKSHQNKFHVETIRRLQSRFENFQEGDVVEEWEKEMWEYFNGLYKNCNKGIKGRGKDRRISSSNASAPLVESPGSSIPSNSRSNSDSSIMSAASSTSASSMASSSSGRSSSMPQQKMSRHLDHPLSNFSHPGWSQAPSAMPHAYSRMNGRGDLPPPY